MSHIPSKFIFCTLLLAMNATPAYARGGAGGGRAAVTSAVAGENVGAGLAAESSAAAGAAAEDNIQAQNAVTTPAAKAGQAAVPACQSPTLMTGTYLGAQLGYGSSRVYNYISPSAPPPLSINYPNAVSNWAAGVLMGYGKMINHLFYLGGEIFINANNTQQNFEAVTTAGTVAYTSQTSSGPTGGIGILPGIKLTDSTLTYIRLGVNRTTSQMQETLTGAVTNSISKSGNGFVFGVGMETLITSNYSLRGEFDHMYINSYNTFSIYNTIVKPSTNQFTMAVIYHEG